MLVRCLASIGSTCLCWRALLTAPLGVASDSPLIVALLIQMIHGNCYDAFKVSAEEGHEPEMILTTPALNAQFDRAGQRLFWWETLQDPALFFGIPVVGLQDDQGQFLERTQVDPAIEVMNDPKSTAEGRDLQLERATTELIKEN